MDQNRWATLIDDALTHPTGAAMERLLTVVRPLVVRRCAKFLPHVHDAEEAAQDALLAIATHLADFDGRGSFEGWVTVISSRQALGTYRSLKRRAVLGIEADLPAGVDPRTTSVIAGTRLDVLDAIEQLSSEHPALVEPFVLRDLGGLTYDEISQLTGAPLGTVKARIHAARAYMREKLSTS